MVSYKGADITITSTKIEYIATTEKALPRQNQSSLSLAVDYHWLTILREYLLQTNGQMRCQNFLTV